MDFLMEIDKLKNIFRQSLLSVDNRRENDAEHSWHLCMYAVVLEEYANTYKMPTMFAFHR